MDDKVDTLIKFIDTIAPEPCSGAVKEQAEINWLTAEHKLMSTIETMKNIHCSCHGAHRYNMVFFDASGTDFHLVCLDLPNRTIYLAAEAHKTNDNIVTCTQFTGFIPRPLEFFRDKLGTLFRKANAQGTLDWYDTTLNKFFRITE